MSVKLILCNYKADFDKQNNKKDLFILVKCNLCQEHVVLNSKNIDKTPICIECATRLIDNNEVSITSFFKKENFKEFLKSIVKFENEND